MSDVPSKPYTPSRTTLLLCLAPILVIAAGMALLGVNIPYVDQLKFVSLLQRSRDGILTAADLFSQNNENRPFFPRLLWLGLASLTRYDVRAELWANLAIAISTFTVFAAYTTRVWNRLGITPSPLLLPLMSFVVFNWGQWESWLNGFQAVFFFGSACAVLGFIMLAEETTWTRFALAALLGTVGSFSTPNAMLYWPIGLLIILLAGSERQRVGRGAVWLVLGGGCIILYMSGWSGPAGFGPALLMTDLVPRADWVANFLGAPLMTIPGAAFPFGILSLCLLILAIQPRAAAGNLRLLLPYLAIAAFVIASGVLASMARLWLGTLQAVAPGYLTISSWYWAALLALTPLIPLPRLARTALHGLVAACLVWLTVWGLALGREYHRRLQRAHDAAVTGAAMSDAILQGISRPEAFDTARAALHYLEENGLSAYAAP